MSTEKTTPWTRAGLKTPSTSPPLWSSRQHANGNEDSAIVNLQMTEVEQETNFDAKIAAQRWWDYYPLFTQRKDAFGCSSIYLSVSSPNSSVAPLSGIFAIVVAKLQLSKQLISC